MSINSLVNRNNYTGNDSTNVYPYTFKVFTKNDFMVVVRVIATGVETELVVDVDYSVSGVLNSSGGNITLIDASQAWLTGGFLEATYDISIRRVKSLVQSADIKNQGSYFPEVHENVFDKQIIISQQQQDEIDRSVKFPESIAPADFNTDLPAVLVGAVSKAIITNATGDGFEAGPTADEISSAQAYAVAASASADAALVSETAAAASAVAADISATDSENSAIASAASAASAAATLASALWRDCVFLTSASSPYAVTSADNGKLFICDTTSGAIIVNLVQISTVSLPFNIGVKLENGLNSVTINRAGTDTIGGATSRVLTSVNSGTQLIAEDSVAPDTWTTADFGTTLYDYSTSLFSGTGAQTAYTIPVSPGSVNNTNVFIDGVYQQKATYTVVGTALTFTEAPPLGTNNIEVNYGQTLSIGEPSDGTVTTAKIADSNVTTAKIADGAITQAKRAALGEQLSASSGNFAIASVISTLDVTNLSVSITTTGRPVRLELVSDGSVNDTIVQCINTGAAVNCAVLFLRGSTVIGESRLGTSATGNTNTYIGLPASSFSYVDIVAAGTYTYKVQLANSSTTSTSEVNYCKLLVYEL